MPINVKIICGTTSSGKSAYAFNLAKEYKEVNILSVDSRQFYKSLPIISGQDNIDDLPKNVTLFGQGFLESDKTPNIAEFQKYAEKIISKSIEDGKHLIIVGGSGLYLKAITQNLSTANVPPDEDFRKEAENLSVANLQEILKKLNPDHFDSLNNSDKNNPRRLIRHIEIQRVRPTPDIYEPRSDISFDWIGLKKTKENLEADIKKRCLQRLENGAVEEVKKLLKKYPNKSLPIYSTLGVKRVIEFIENKIDKEELINLWTSDDLNYAKRQIVWFKKQPQIVWYDNSI